MKFIALDLELNNAPDNSTPKPKIIEVGIAYGYMDDYLMHRMGVQEHDSITHTNWYIDPHEPIYPFITKLTGISNDSIRGRTSTHGLIASEIKQITQKEEFFPNFVVWGSGDYNDYSELRSEMIDRGIEFNYGRRVIDVKTIHTFMMLSKGKKPSGGLSSALSQYGLKFEGTPHRAADDAYNTLRLFFQLMVIQKNYHNIISIATYIEKVLK